MDRARDTRRLLKTTKGWEREQEGMQVWFRDLYGRDFDHHEDGSFHGKDSRDGTIESAIRCAIQ